MQVSHVGMLRPMGWSTGRKPSHTPSVWRPRNSVSSAMTVMSLSSMTQLKSKCFLLLILFSIDFFSAGILKVSERYSFKEIWRKLKKVLAAPEGSNHTHIKFAMRLIYTTEQFIADLCSLFSIYKSCNHYWWTAIKVTESKKKATTLSFCCHTLTVPP